MTHLTTLIRRVACCLVLVVAPGTPGAAVSVLAQHSTASAAVSPIRPVEPVRAILDALQSHDLVALDEGRHGNEQAHALRLALVRHPTFARIVNDIVVEFGNARYQKVMDRFIAGEHVPTSELRHAWQDTTQHAVWDVPIFEEFFRAVRQVNQSLPNNRRLRVLLADPPIDWTTVRSAPDHFKWLRLRDTYGAELIRREVLAKKRKALLIFGALHLQRRNVSANYEPIDGAETVVSMLDHAATAKIFTIRTPTEMDPQWLQAKMASWRRPSLVILRGTRLGALDAATFWSSDVPRFAMRDGKPSPLPRDQWRVVPM